MLGPGLKHQHMPASKWDGSNSQIHERRIGLWCEAPIPEKPIQLTGYHWETSWSICSWCLWTSECSRCRFIIPLFVTIRSVIFISCTPTKKYLWNYFSRSAHVMMDSVAVKWTTQRPIQREIVGTVEFPEHQLWSIPTLDQEPADVFHSSHVVLS